MNKDVAIFIISRDRLNCLQDLICILEKWGYHNLHIMDSDSEYSPLLEYYEELPYPIYRLKNLGPVSPWCVDAVADIRANQEFIVTDPDVYPSSECPDDVVDRMFWVLGKNDRYDKVGPSLNIFNLPDHYPHKKEAIKWEKQFWHNRGPDRTWNSPVDTTFSLHRRGTEYKITEALRLDRPYMFDHMPWYLDFDNLPEDELFYMNRLNPKISNWNRVNLPEDHVI